MYIDFLSSLHKSTERDYLGRVNDREFPKFKAAELAKKWDFDYWDGDRRICYGGYNYIQGRWAANPLISHYSLKKLEIRSWMLVVERDFFFMKCY